jgi:hypothetical protein
MIKLLDQKWTVEGYGEHFRVAHYVPGIGPSPETVAEVYAEKHVAELLAQAPAMARKLLELRDVLYDETGGMDREVDNILRAAGVLP